MNGVCVCVYTTCVPGANKGQKGALDPQGPE